MPTLRIDAPNTFIKWHKLTALFFVVLMTSFAWLLANATAGTINCPISTANFVTTININLDDETCVDNSNGAISQISIKNISHLNQIEITTYKNNSTPGAGVSNLKINDDSFTPDGSGKIVAPFGQCAQGGPGCDLNVSGEFGTTGTFSFNLSVPGGFTGDVTLSPITTGSISTPDTISITSGSGQDTAISSSFGNPLIVTVSDSGSNPVSGETVTFTSPSGVAGLSLTTQTATTNASGQASLSATANAVAGGPYTVSASVTGVVASADFSLTNNAGEADAISVVSGSGQSAELGKPFGSQLVVVVKDQNSNVTPDVSVVFEAPASGGSVVFASSGTNTETVLTDADGLATSSAMTANLISSEFLGENTFSDYSVTARVNGITAASFSLTNTRSSEADIARTRQVIATFTANRADRIIAEQPNMVTRLQSGSFGNQKGINNLFYDVSENSQSASFQFSLAAFQNRAHKKQDEAANEAVQRIANSFSLLGFAEQGQSAGGANEQSIFEAVANSGAQTQAEVSGFDFWAQGTYARVNNNDYISDNGLFFAGLDYRYKNIALFGLMAQLDISEEENSSAGTSARGVGWMVGPYSVVRLHQNLFFDARATYGTSSNDVNALGIFEDYFDTVRFLLQAGLTGDFSLGVTTINPFARLTYYYEQQEDYTDSLRNLIPSQDFDLGRLEFGPRVSFDYTTEDGMMFSPFFSLSGICDFKKLQNNIPTDAVLASSDEDIRARIEAGTKVLIPYRGISLESEGFYDGIGASDYEAYGARVNMRIPF
ncbi:outer membrane autotransporter barrel domain-containing protein [Pseudovibrio sp. Tun.PSC04-5.I4]|nr:outer membrane autotransporter barrel domain-containing protein [Pseudovibrio sp. Tun.PSC04-5.I4]